ncbi:hypothetical protein A3B21_02720 [Candidatus Uhrbacteria bacterium RIFCSPLOWO2_01_FULL_47_24]|uniref:DoxX family protein n=1 Tax=Candidatus Uhrbacteria bacterium RIFCSPLOWO2_01_FULL_47_24 TaxID=1802401 RepID=A0A1F7UTZ3_9BACT|nr:MAG: hypothetical protein A2753_04340 [Candidatus Uhrbacteria bacterium RIFCSPHIGHO2_01_FULL_47_11]OGL74695.1 MAG: hypothetical protein A3F52_00005 [Candidatus Uhrbacteria bacterium RIFCSPHIGHO2_12_FULL_47_11]OGL81178.1 MAG: hypothetical protein A3B21_02720 [Candidatus Uhrbacteria bacterium RIFCSPLOWO2_01_FULL_47_24]
MTGRFPLPALKIFIMQNEKLAILFLRVGIATVFLYASVAAMLDPNSWIGFFPEFLRNIFPAKLLLYTHSIAELILALWIFSGWKMFYAGLLSAGALLTIIIANITLFDIVFRDIAIFFAALALAVLSRK